MPNSLIEKVEEARQAVNLAAQSVHAAYNAAVKTNPVASLILLPEIAALAERERVLSQLGTALGEAEGATSPTKAKGKRNGRSG